MPPYGSNYIYGGSPFYIDDGVVSPSTSVCNDGTTLTPTTALDIIKRALRLLCVLATGEAVDGPESHDALEQLNWMIQSWDNEKLMTWYLVNEIWDISAGTGTYTIGPDSTQDFNTTLPITIESAFCRDSSSGYNNDYKLQVIPNDQYQDIFQKGILTSYPKYINYVKTYPYGVINIWPIPTITLKLSLSQRKQFSQFTGLTSVVCLPPGYKTALAYNLALHLAPEYGANLDPLVIRMANETKAVLKNTNFEPVIMSTDSFLIPRRMYNIYTDRY